MHYVLYIYMSGWPSGLRRQTQDISCIHSNEHSGPLMWAWVQIPLLTFDNKDVIKKYFMVHLNIYKYSNELHIKYVQVSNFKICTG